MLSVCPIQYEHLLSPPWNDDKSFEHEEEISDMPFSNVCLLFVTTLKLLLTSFLTCAFALSFLKSWSSKTSEKCINSKKESLFLQKKLQGKLGDIFFSFFGVNTKSQRQNSCMQNPKIKHKNLNEDQNWPYNPKQTRRKQGLALRFFSL